MPILIMLNYFMAGRFVLVSTDGANIGTSCYSNYFKKTINILMQLRVREIDTGNMAEMLDDGFYQHEKSTD